MRGGLSSPANALWEPLEVVAVEGDPLQPHRTAQLLGQLSQPVAVQRPAHQHSQTAAQSALCESEPEGPSEQNPGTGQQQQFPH